MLLDPEQMIETSSNTAGNSVAFQYSAPRILCRKSYSLNGPKRRSFQNPPKPFGNALHVERLARH